VKLVSQYDLLPEQYDRHQTLSTVETAISEARRAQENLGNVIHGISLLVSEAYDLDDLEQAESELRDALVALERLKTARNYANQLVKELGQ
jgi:hypothetical protein